MPRPPSPTARFGTRFHAWVESRFGQQDLFDPDELPGRADADIDSDDELRELIAAFEKGLFADRVPHAVEAPFALVLAGQVVRGRIDAVYAEQVADEPGFLVVDWKTGRREDADPLQLALYRLAWADLTGVPVERVRAGFYYVRSGPARRAPRPPGPGRADAAGQPGCRAAVSATSTIRPKVCSRSWEVVSSPVTMWSETVQIASARRPCFAARV